METNGHCDRQRIMKRYFESCLVISVKVNALLKDCKNNEASNADDTEMNQTNQNTVGQHSKPESIILSGDESSQHVRSLKRKYKSKKVANRSKSKVQYDSSNEKSLTNSTKHQRKNKQSTYDQSDSVIIDADLDADVTGLNSKSAINRGKKVTVIAGDSIIKNIQGWRLSNPPNHVVVKSFAGANSTDMEDYLRPILRKEPDKIILHVGTNDISHQSARRVAQGIANLGTQIVQDSPATSLVISSILPRTDKPELSKKVVEANEHIKAFCNGNNWEFMDHAAIDSSCLNMRGLHLNRIRVPQL